MSMEMEISNNTKPRLELITAPETVRLGYCARLEGQMFAVLALAFAFAFASVWVANDVNYRGGWPKIKVFRGYVWPTPLAPLTRTF